MRPTVQCPRCSKHLPAGAAYCNRCGFDRAAAGRRLAEFTGQGARALRVGVLVLVLLIVVMPLVVSNTGSCSGSRSSSRIEQTPDGRTNVDVRSVGGCSASNSVHIHDAPPPPPRSAVTPPPPPPPPATAPAEPD